MRVMLDLLLLPVAAVLGVVVVAVSVVSFSFSVRVGLLPLSRMSQELLLLLYNLHAIAIDR